MDDRSALRVMTAIAAAILVSMFVISILARMNMLQGVGVQPNIVAPSLVSIVVMMGSSMVTPSLPLYAQGIGADEFLAGALIAGFAIGRFAFDVPEFPAGIFATIAGLFALIIVVTRASLCRV